MGIIMSSSLEEDVPNIFVAIETSPCQHIIIHIFCPMYPKSCFSSSIENPKTPEKVLWHSHHLHSKKKTPIDKEIQKEIFKLQKQKIGI